MDHSCEVWLKLAHWYRRSCHLKQIVDDAGQPVTDPNSSLRAFHAHVSSCVTSFGYNKALMKIY